MIKDQDIPELGAYRACERLLPFAARQDYERLVVFGQNDAAPVHNWFRFKEGFSANLLKCILQEFDSVLPINKLSLLDPYCGSGTSLLSSQWVEGRSISAVGIERSPFIHFVAKTKCSWQSMDFHTLCDDGQLAIDFAKELDVSLPGLTSGLIDAKAGNVSLHATEPHKRYLISTDESPPRCK